MSRMRQRFLFGIAIAAAVMVALGLASVVHLTPEAPRIALQTDALVAVAVVAAALAVGAVVGRKCSK